MKKLILIFTLSLVAMPLSSFANARKPPKMVTKIVLEVTAGQGTFGPDRSGVRNNILSSGFTLNKPCYLVYDPNSNTPGFLGEHEYSLTHQQGNLVRKVRVHVKQSTLYHDNFASNHIFIANQIDGHITYDQEIMTTDGKMVASENGVEFIWETSDLMETVQTNGVAGIRFSLRELGGFPRYTYGLFLNTKKYSEFTLPLYE